MWLGMLESEEINEEATKWGWKVNLGRLIAKAIADDLELIPKSLLKIISCSCESGCNKRCGCRKHGLKCTNLCVKCQDNCSNREIQIIENESNLDQDIVAEQPQIHRNNDGNQETDADDEVFDDCSDEEES